MHGFETPKPFRIRGTATNSAVLLERLPRVDSVHLQVTPNEGTPATYDEILMVC